MDLGIYLHVPFCRVRCGYCDFNTFAGHEALMEPYLSALQAELVARLDALAEPPRIRAVYFGGGTPSLAPPSAIGRLLRTIDERADLAASAEISLEANPGTVERSMLDDLRAAGVNRLTLGVQSFDDAELRILDRLHDAAAARRAIDEARAAGFERLNVDLMFALPGQDLASWERSLDEALGHDPGHLSLYNLTIEPDTPFGARQRRGELRAAPEELEAVMFERSMELLAAAGYARYEISNACRPGQRCVHNSIYWNGDAYLGLGAGAHGFDPQHGAWGRRWWNIDAPSRYVTTVGSGQLPEAGHEELSAGDAAQEVLLLALRTVDGLDVASFAQRFSVDPAGWLDQPRIRRLIHRGALRWSKGRLRVSQEHMILTDSITLELASRLEDRMDLT